VSGGRGWDLLVEGCTTVAAPGTDAELLARVVAWAVRPRRSLEAIRRSCRDAGATLLRAETAAIRDVVADHVDADDAAAATPLVQMWAAAGVRAALVGDATYPVRLAEGWPETDGPTLLAWRGAAVPDVPTVAGLADVVVVVEGGERSGALLTAGAAAERGRTVLAVPGDVRADGSVAPHRLLSEGAAPCTGPPDLLQALGGPRCGEPVALGVAAAGLSTLPDDVHALLAARWPRPVRIDELARTTARAIGPLLAAITRARVAGELAEGPEGVRLRRAPG